MKKIIISLLLVAMISVMLMPAYAAGTSIEVADVTATAGDTVTVDVTIAGNTGFGSGKFVLTYDTEALTLTGLDVEEKLLDGGAVNSEKGIISFASATNVTEDGVLFTATFTVKADAAIDVYNVTVNVQDMVNAETAEPVTIAEATGEVEIVCGEHDWDEGVVTTKPECGKAGVKTYTCKACGETKTESIPALEHEWEEKDGQLVCKHCGEIKIPDTGDNTVQTVMMVVSLMGMIAVAGTVTYRRRLSK